MQVLHLAEKFRGGGPLLAAAIMESLLLYTRVLSQHGLVAPAAASGGALTLTPARALPLALARTLALTLSLSLSLSLSQTLTLTLTLTLDPNPQPGDLPGGAAEESTGTPAAKASRGKRPNGSAATAGTAGARAPAAGGAAAAGSAAGRSGVAELTSQLVATLHEALGKLYTQKNCRLNTRFATEVRGRGTVRVRVTG